MSEPLSADPARQANAAIAGYDYQLWYSVYAWCLLQRRENLYLEGAEDLDIIRDSTADTIQVKQTSRPITFASPAVRDALVHWWQHRERNPAYAVHLHFVTPATPAVERGAPFGKQPGLSYWEDVKRPGADIGPLKTFVRARLDLPPDFRDTIGRWSAEEFRDECVRRIAWVTGAPSRGALRAAVERALIEECDERYPTPPNEARRLAAQLRDMVVDAIVTNRRDPLTRASFLIALEELLTRRVAPVSAVRARSGTSLVPFGVIPGEPGAEAWAWSSTGPLDSIEQVASSAFVVRTELVQGLVERLSQHGALLLKGSMGMGKSTLARQVTEAFGGQWKLLDLRGCEPSEIRGRLRAATSAVACSRGTAGILLDDLNFDDQSTLYENALISLLQAGRLAHINVIVTGHLDFPTRVAFEAEFRDTLSVLVPPLSEDQTRELAERHGCPRGVESESWGRVVHLSTHGHPLLAGARVCCLRDEGWPTAEEAKITRLAEATDLQVVQLQARQRLAEALPSPEARQFVYRLSLCTAPFTRARALQISEAVNPGDLFDRLCGPWVEGSGVAGEFRVSPLLRGAAAQALDEQAVRAIRRRICDVVLQPRRLSQLDFAEAVSQAFLASYDGGLIRIAVASLQIPSERSRQVLGCLLWLPLVKVTPGEVLFEGNPMTSIYLRDLQFRTAVATDAQTVGQIVRCWDHELRRLDSRVREERRSQATLDGVRALRGMFLFKSLWTPEVSLEPEQAARYGSEFLRLIRAPPPAFPVRALDAENGSDFRIDTETIEVMVRHSQGTGRALALVEALATLGEEGDETLLDEFRRDGAHAVTLMTSAFAGAATQDPPLKKLTALIDAAIRLGHERGVPALTAAAWRTWAVYHWECRSDSASALAALNAGTIDAGDYVPILQDYRARILGGTGQEQEALDIWRQTLGTASGGDWVRLFSAREAGIAASRIGRHGEAQAFFAMSEALARRLSLPAMAAGLVGEQALEAWRAGSRASAVSTFARALGDLPSLPDPESDLRSRDAHKMLGHAVLWCLRQTPGSRFFGEGSLIEPEPGRLSPLTPAEAMRSLPLGLLADAWGALAALEMDCAVGDAIYGEWCRRWSQEALHSANAALEARARWALRGAKAVELVDLGSRLFDAIVAIEAESRRAASSAGQERLEPELQREGARTRFIADLLGASVVSRVERDPEAALPFHQWRQEAGALGIMSHELDAWFAGAEELRAGTRDVIAVARGLPGADMLRVPAAAVLVTRPKNATELFVASAILVGTYRQSVWRLAMEDVVERLVVAAWIKLLAEQRLSLVAPARAAPAIDVACHDQSCSGLKRASRVLLAASIGISRVPAWAANMLNELAQ